MCQYQIWFRDEKQGFVIECNQCRKIQVAFGMMMVNFEEAGFQRFRLYIQDKLNSERIDPYPNEKNILLSTPCESLNLLFSYRELSGLHNMLELADTEMKTQKMLQLFQE